MTREELWSGSGRQEQEIEDGLLLISKTLEEVSDVAKMVESNPQLAAIGVFQEVRYRHHPRRGCKRRCRLPNGRSLMPRPPTKPVGPSSRAIEYPSLPKSP